MNTYKITFDVRLSKRVSKATKFMGRKITATFEHDSDLTKAEHYQLFEICCEIASLKFKGCIVLNISNIKVKAK